MSGIVGIVHRDGKPADRSLLEQMTGSLAFRGPDAQSVWVQGPAGLGHALLRTTVESNAESQPFTLGAGAWIVADARIDARQELIAALAADGHRVSTDSPDAELILHAYRAWGEACVDHLLGDFCFAIWDAPARRLFCARDHFGVKPFYYADLGGRLVFGNTPGCFFCDPDISPELDDRALADFLLFGSNRDVSTTAFAQMRRLSPAHSLSFSPAGLAVQRYWTLPAEEPHLIRDARELTGQFRELLGRAVNDRLRTPSAAVLLSGGLDSSTVTALARRNDPHLQLRAYTTVTEHLWPDPERQFAPRVAAALDIPIAFQVIDAYKLFERWRETASFALEPVHDPFAAATLDQTRQIARQHRVALTGQGGDPALATSITSYAALLLRRGGIVSLARDFGRFFTSEGRMRRLYLLTRLRVLGSRFKRPGSLPAWLAPELCARLPLEERWREHHQAAPTVHPLRPAGYAALLAPEWPELFASLDPGATGVPVEFRHPYFDLRVVRFLLRLPPVPLCTDKEIVRVAMRGLLPDEVRLRPKTPLPAEPVPLLLRQNPDRWWNHIAPSPRLARYVEWSRVPHLTGDEDYSEAWRHLLPVSLNLWLTAMDSKRRAADRCSVALAG